MTRLRSKETSMVVFAAIFAVLSYSLAAFAWPPTFGPEFTFTNAKIYEASQSEEKRVKISLRDEMLETIKGKCPKCSFGPASDGTPDAVRVTFPDDWWFQVSLDPGVIEVQAKPETFERYRQLEPRIREFIFKSANKVDLAPHPNLGGGHIHMGLLSAFDNNQLLFRNYVVDTMNHPELAMGIFSKDYINSPPVAILGEEAKKEMKAVLAEFDADPKMTIEKFAQAIQSVFIKRPT